MTAAGSRSPREPIGCPRESSRLSRGIARYRDGVTAGRPHRTATEQFDEAPSTVISAISSTGRVPLPAEGVAPSHPSFRNLQAGVDRLGPGETELALRRRLFDICHYEGIINETILYGSLQDP